MELAEGRSLRLVLVPDEGPGPDTDRACTPLAFLRDASLSAAAFWMACMLGEAFEREDADPEISGAS